MKQRTISFHQLLVVIAALAWIPCAIFFIYHIIYIGPEFTGLSCVPMIYFIITSIVALMCAAAWAAEQDSIADLFYDLCNWNPTITLGKKASIPKATIEKEL